MANDIYSTTHDGLSKLVSPRVASRVLKSALRKRKLSPENVTAKDMKVLLRGPVLDELTGILPKGGLEHSLQRLSKSVANLKTPTLVEALTSPEPWDDTPPLSAAAYSEGTPQAVKTSVTPILEESPPPSKVKSPNVEISKTASDPAFDTEPETLPSNVNYQDADAPAKTFQAEPSATPARETAVAEPDTQTSADEASATLEAAPPDLDPKGENDPDQNVLAQGDMQPESLDESVMVGADPRAESPDESSDFAQDPYATLIDAPLLASPGNSALADPSEELSVAPDPGPLRDAVTIAKAEDGDIGHTASVADAEEASELAQSSPTDELLGEAILQFAQLDHVRMVAALVETKVASSRGSGFDLETLSRLGTLGLKLLSRSGELRSYYLAFEGGQLFFFPLPGYTLCIIGTTELNLGLVFATLQKLKEDV